MKEEPTFPDMDLTAAQQAAEQIESSLLRNLQLGEIARMQAATGTGESAERHRQMARQFSAAGCRELEAIADRLKTALGLGLGDPNPAIKDEMRRVVDVESERYVKKVEDLIASGQIRAAIDEIRAIDDPELRLVHVDDLLDALSNLRCRDIPLLEYIISKGQEFISGCLMLVQAYLDRNDISNARRTAGSINDPSWRSECFLAIYARRYGIEFDPIAEEGIRQPVS